MFWGFSTDFFPLASLRMEVSSHLDAILVVRKARQFMKLRLLSLALFGITLSAPLATAGNIVLNPSFESGSANWTLDNNGNPWFINSQPHSGSLDIESQCAGAICVDPVNGTFFYQNLSTVIGQTYSLSFWAFVEGAPDEIKVTWGGVTALDIVNPVVPNDVYAQYSTTSLLATSTTTQLEFFGRQDPNQSLGVDDISVTAIPEPSSLALISVALLIAAGFRRRHLIWSGTPAVATAKRSSK